MNIGIRKKTIVFLLLSSMIIASIVSITPVPLGFSLTDLDQNQNDHSSFISFYDSIHLAQAFQPSRSLLTGIEVYVRKSGTIDSPINMRVLRDSITGPSVVDTMIGTDEILTEGSWVDIPVDNVSVIPDQPYFIILSTDMGTTVNCYQWGHGENNTYTRGVGYISNTNGSSWFQLSTVDFAFRTYGYTPETDSELEFMYLRGKFGEIIYGVKNTGKTDITDLSISVTFSTGLILGQKTHTYHHDIALQPGKEIHNLIYPVIGLGPATILVSLSASEILPFTKTYQALLFLIYVYVY